MNNEFKFLRVSSVIFKVLAWISAVFFLIVTIVVILGAGGEDTPRAASLIFLVGGAFYFLTLFSISEVFRILLILAGKVENLLEIIEGKSANT